MKTVKLPFKIKEPALACGADLKGAFALAKGGKAYLFEDFGDLSDPDNLRDYEEAIGYYEKKLRIRPAVIARDCHPDYFSGKFAELHSLDLKAPGICDVQHHEAHVSSVITEHSIRSDVIGVAFDGSGYGRDGRIWGAEFFAGNPKHFRRAAHLEYTPMPGGDAVIKQPWRMALSYLYRAFGEGLLKLDPGTVNTLGKRHWPVIKKMIDGGINSPLTSSAGRLFDGAGSLILSRPTASFEAELPMELEKIASPHCRDKYGFDIRSKDGMLIIESSKLIEGIVYDMSSKIDNSVISAKFHNTIAEMIVRAALRIRRDNGTRKIVLSGGVFQNRYLTKRVVLLLKKYDFDVYANSIVNTNDYGIPIGQLAIANAMSQQQKV